MRGLSAVANRESFALAGDAHMSATLSIRRVLIVTVIALIGIGIVAYPYIAAYTDPRGPTVSQFPVSPQEWGTPMMIPGLNRPEVVSADAAQLPDEEPVIGVVCDGGPRAYCLKALLAINCHVVNDVVGGTPVSITYCDKNDCVQAFTGGKRDRPLEIGLAGWQGRMMLNGPNGFFWQHNGQMVGPDFADFMPHELMPFSRVSWQQWRSAHPDTQVYVGADRPKY